MYVCLPGTYKDCLNKQKQLEREESDEDNTEEFNEDEIIEAEKPDKATRKRKRKQVKVRI